MKNTAICATLLLAGLPASFATAQPDTAHIQPLSVAPPSSKELAAKAMSWLREQQDKEVGGWSINAKGPTFPAITALVVSGMLANGVDAGDPAVAAGLKFILSKQQPDGGIYDKLLPSYNTAICLSALGRLKNPDAATKAAMLKAQQFLKGLQFGEEAMGGEGNAEKVGKDHPFYGGFGYGSHGRPDLSNTAWALEGLHASGLSEQDVAFQRALVFLQRCQMLEKTPDGKTVNDMPYAKGSHQGGFVYATAENKDTAGKGQTQSNEISETLTDGTNANRLRCYGSMTYSGLKSYLYAGLKKDDPRVKAAMDWIRSHYELRWNAGMPSEAEGGKPGQQTDGMYYYYVVFARALRAYGESTVQTVGSDGQRTPRAWRQDLASQLATLQNADGSFRSVDDRWMENNPVLITAYSLIALGEASESGGGAETAPSAR